MSTGRRNLLLLLLALVIAGVPALSALGVLPPLVPGAAWSGGDTQITEVVGQVREGYRPWFGSLFRPDELGIERYMFGLQALLGTAVLAAFIGYLAGRHSRRLGRSGGERRTAALVSAVGIAAFILLFFVKTDLGELQAFITALQCAGLGTLGFFAGYPLGMRDGARGPGQTGRHVEGDSSGTPHAHGHYPAPLPSLEELAPLDGLGTVGVLDGVVDDAPPIMEVIGVSFAYRDGTQALRDLSLSIPQGRRVAILGANGCGKSTLFLHLNGILRPAQGEVRLAGHAVRYDRQGLTDLRRRVGLVFQDPDSQLFAATVRQDISFGPMNLGLSEVEVRARVERAIHESQIEELADRPTHLLSYGQKKRVAIAGVLVMEPDVIIADEPTAGLDPEMTARLLALLNRLHESGRTIVISTHDVELALAWADHVLVLRRGQRLAAGRPEQLFRDRALLAKARLVQPIVLDAYARLLACGVGSGAAPAADQVPRSAAELAAWASKHAIFGRPRPEAPQAVDISLPSMRP